MEDKKSDILEYPFDFQRYIGQRLQKIDDLEERKFAKKLLMDDFLSIVKATEYKYKKLENCIYEELEIPINKYTICSTIGKSKDYNQGNNLLFPVCLEDLNKEELKEQLSSDELIYLETIYLQLPKMECIEFEKQKRRIGCMVNLETSQLVYALIKPSERYMKEIEWLYQLFLDNQIPWVTVNTGHIEKFYDVYLCASEEVFDMELGKVEIDWGEYKAAIFHGLLPLWNINRIPFDSADFKATCSEGIYEHIFAIEQNQDSSSYLIENNKDIIMISQDKNGIVLKSLKKTFEKWIAVQIIFNKNEMHPYNNFPVLSNAIHDSFFRRLSKKSYVNLMTMGDLYRRIMEFDIREYVEFTGYEIFDIGNDFPIIKGMNWFVEDELFPIENRKVLLLKFIEKKARHYLNDCMMQFAVSQIQLEINEYRCVGVIV